MFFRFGDRFSGWALGRLKRRLRLDDAQAARFDRLGESIRDLVGHLHEGRSYQDQALAELLGDGPLDRAQAQRLARLPLAMADDVMPPLVERFAEFFDSLDPDQRQTVRRLLLRRRRWCRR